VNVGAGKPVAVTVNEPAAPTVNVALFALVICGAWSTVNVKFCTAFVPTPFEAVNLMGYAPPVLAAGVPLSTPVDGVNVTPFGSAPDSLRVGVGVPDAITVKDPAAPTVKVVLVALVNMGAVSTVSVKFCVAFGAIPFDAVNMMLYVPRLPDAGVPASVAVPFPLSVNVTPLGSVPDSVIAGAGGPVAVTVNVPAAPTVNVVLFALVIVGAWSTVRVKFCTKFAPTPFEAVNLMGYVPPVPAAGVPLSIPVDGVNVTPVGSVPDSLNVGVGTPVAVTVNVPGVPAVNVTLFALVMAGAWSTVSVKFWVPFGAIPFAAVNVMGKEPAAVGVPFSVPVPFPLSVKVTPLGSVPASVRAGAGKPVAVTVNVPAAFTVNVALFALVIFGASSTVSVKFWTAFAPTPFEAVNLIGYVPPLPDTGAPARVPVPLPLSVKVRPPGSAPVSVRAGAGKPVVVTLNEPAVPAVKVTLLALVKAGAWPTVSVKLWATGEPTPLLGVNVIG
jgi:hypothetical protein